jgi:large subunit ribosomal protein L15
MTFQIQDLKPAAGSTHKRKRVGRGRSSGHGKTCGRGTKGEKARNKIRPGFEGGQMPLQRRLPKLKGFKPRNKKEYQLVNVSKLNVFADGEQVTPEALQAHGLVKGIPRDIKILGAGELERKLTVKAHKQDRSPRGERRGGLAC